MEEGHNMEMIFHAQDSTYKSPLGAVPAQSPVRFQIDLPHGSSYEQPTLLVCQIGRAHV